MTSNNPLLLMFRPARSRAESRAEITDRAARDIVEAETELRQSKTEMLRKARLEREAAQSVIVTKNKRTKASVSRVSRARTQRVQ